MQSFAFFSILIFIFTIPWENMIVFQEYGTISRVVGMFMFVMVAIAFIFKNRVRAFPFFYILFTAFTAWGILSYFWSIDQALSLVRIISYLQLFVFVLILWVFVKSTKHIHYILQAYVFGCLVSIASTILAFKSGKETVYLRYAATGFDPNELSIILSMGMSIAWYLATVQKNILFKWINRIFVPLAAIAILLTGSRTGLLAGLFSGLFVLATMIKKREVALFIATMVILVISVIAAIQVIPESTWNRFTTFENEIGGTFSGRTVVWNLGGELVLKSPVLGIGVGGFPAAAHTYLGADAAAHNSFISIVVELGLVGLFLFLLIWIQLWKALRQLNSYDRSFYLFTLVSLIAGLLTLTWETKKPLWLIFSLLVIHASFAKSAFAESHPDKK